ncbi:hypothetical protein C943_03938 [Mariniradius saccharolyticus AK6]|uniref:Uncharacterized protein n=1 Tax=Mariniradius saccharolyticus AK6 TaxID=1239962 RepID=M7YAB1_9BACT|nr:hypothetical protein C943_03938 [Mariniradius saccharolyticus AK6]
MGNVSSFACTALCEAQKQTKNRKKTFKRYLLKTDMVTKGVTVLRDSYYFQPK